MHGSLISLQMPFQIVGANVRYMSLLSTSEHKTVGLKLNDPVFQLFPSHSVNKEENLLTSAEAKVPR